MEVDLDFSWPLTFNTDHPEIFIPVRSWLLWQVVMLARVMQDMLEGM